MDIKIHTQPVLSLEREDLYWIGIAVDQVDDATFKDVAYDVQLALLGVFYSRVRIAARKANLPMRFSGQRL